MGLWTLDDDYDDFSDVEIICGECGEPLDFEDYGRNVCRKCRATGDDNWHDNNRFDDESKP